MKRLLFLLALAMPAAAQTLNLYPVGPLTVPLKTTQTATAIVGGLGNKSVNFTTDCGTIVGTNPFTANEPATVGLYSTTAQTCHLTATSVADSSLHSTVAITFGAAPTITTGHPRLMITAAELSGLQAKATSGNTLYQAQLTYANTYYYNSSSPFWPFSTWNGSACVGGTTPGSLQTYEEGIAQLFGWLSLVAPNSTLRNQYGCAGRDIWTYEMTQILTGTDPISGNRWSDSSEAFTQNGDWLMPYMSSGDITQQRTFNAYALKGMLSVSGNFVGPIPVIPPATATYNSSSVWASLSSLRGMGSNYEHSLEVYLTGLPLMFDDNTTDDPPLSNTCSATRYQVCSDFTAGSMHAYFNYYAGTVLYLEWAHREDPNVAWQAYQTAFGNLSTQPQCPHISGNVYVQFCFGDGRGGESSEGSWYRYSDFRTVDAMNQLVSTGYNDPAIWGPQMSMVTTSWWDMQRVENMEFLTFFNQSNGGVGANKPSYGFLDTGDSNTYYALPLNFQTESSLMALDAQMGRTDRTGALEWPVLNSAYGGINGTNGTCVGTNSCGFTAGLSGDESRYNANNLFFALPAGDPTASPPADPRPSYPTDIYNASFNQHQMVRNSWTNPTVFSYYCGNTLIDHEEAACGGFDLISAGEFITKGRVVFDDYNVVMARPLSSNQVAIQNVTGSGASSIWAFAAQYGGEWFHGEQPALTPPLNHSELPAYTADIIDDTNLYNGWWVSASPYDVASYNDVTSASRSLIYLRGSNDVVIYDRAATGSSSATKTFNMTATGTPTISGLQASWPTRSGTQKAWLTSLLPAGATLSNQPATAFVSATTPYGNLQQGTTMQITTTSHNGDGTTSNVSSIATYSSNDSTIASVSSTGLITGTGIGMTYIWVYVENIPVIYVVNVVSGASSGTWALYQQNTNQTGDWEVGATLQVAPSGTPSSTQFLSHLTWGSSGLSAPTDTLVNSSAGQTFQGALLSAALVMFSQTYPFTFTGTTFPASSATTVYVSDLTPNTSYPITGAGTPGSATTDTAGVLTFAATGTGSISVGASTPTAAQPTFSPVGGTYSSSQTVTISTTSGTVICYNTTGSPATNGTTGCTAGTVYSSPVSVATSETLYAVAGGTGLADSTVGSAVYTITPPTAGVTIGGNVTMSEM